MIYYDMVSEMQTKQAAIRAFKEKAERLFIAALRYDERGLPERSDERLNEAASAEDWAHHLRQNEDE